MKRSLLGLVTATLAMTGCGWYTNIPASIFIFNVKPGLVTYEPPDTRGIREIKIQQPVVRFQGEPGSIGANFDTMVVRYILITGAESKSMPRLNMLMSFRVDSSNYPKQPKTGAIDQSTQGAQVDVGFTEVELPLVTRHVEDFGLQSQPPEGNAPALTAEVTLSGADDANLPVALVARVPIMFSGSPGSGK